MNKKRYQAEHVIKLLNGFIFEYCDNSQARFAELYDSNATYISGVLNGKRPIPDWMLDLVGFVKQKDVYYTKK